jgi:uncharacterized repeat protein (TIGR01451 family)
MRLERSMLVVLTAAALLSAGDSSSPSATARPAVCFAPGTDPSYVERLYRALQGRQLGPAVLPFQFDDGNRWSQTATNGGGLDLGQPTTLTWSVVPDGTFIPTAFSGDPAGNSNLRARLNSIYGSESVWRPLFQQALDEWGSRTGITYVFSPNDDGAALPNPSFIGSLGVLGVRGDVRIGGRTIDGDSGILAYNWFPDAGDMVIDTADGFYDDLSNGSLRLRNVVTHEGGHGIGIDHVCPISQTKLMEPFFSPAFTGTQHDDILAGNRGYGDNREDNDSAGTGTNFGSVGNGTFTANGSSLDGSNDLDFYRFTVAAGTQVDVTLTPVGSTYPQGPTLANGNCPVATPPSFNSLVQNDVALQVISTNGTTVLASANLQGPGGVETLSNVALPGAGQFFIRVSGGGNDAIQLYNLSFTIEGQAVADLSITKTDGQSAAVPGQPITYTIVATNTSTSTAANGATVADTFPAGVTGVSWTCTPSAGSSCIVGSGAGNINRTVNLLPSGSVTFAATGTVAPGATGTLANTATVTPPSGLTDPVAANNTATDTDTLTPQADLAITKTDGSSTEIPGTPVTYTIIATNPGPSTATGATVADAFPAALTGMTWTCVASAGSTCAPSGAGAISTGVTLLPTGTATFTATGTVSPTATGTLVNTATLAAPAGLTDGNPANNTATDTDMLTPQADLIVLKSDGQATAVPGTVVTYTISVLNGGPSASGSATVTDAVPASMSGVTWTCAASAGSSCPPSGSGNIAAAVTLGPGGVATFTATGTIAPSATGTLQNTATAAAASGVTDTNPGNNSATDIDVLTPQADFRIIKTDGQLVATPGAPITYTIQVTHGGPSNSPAATVTDTFPAAISGVSWTCAASGGSSCPASGSGNINAAVTLLPGGTATFSATGNVSAGATGALSNTAQVAAPGAVTDPLAGNNSATDTDNVTLDMAELRHGFRLVRDLRPVGAAPADHFYWLSQKPYSSYEVLLDGVSGDIGPTLVLQRLAGDGTTVLQQSVGASALGFGRSLRFVNDRPVTEEGQLLRVRSGSCGSNCGPDDVYRIRLRDTTGRVARFNNSTSQITVLILQNVSGGPLTGTTYFWRANGTLAAAQPFSLASRASLVLNTGSLPGLAGTAGAVTIAHDGGYGGLAGKTVALEPATGFSFDSPLVLVAP